MASMTSGSMGLIGAIVAGAFLLAVANKDVLIAVIVIFLAAAGSLRMVNYALYCAGIAAGVLIALDLPNPTDFSTEGRRVLYTLAGVGLAALVSLLLTQLSKRSAKAPAKAA